MSWPWMVLEAKDTVHREAHTSGDVGGLPAPVFEDEGEAVAGNGGDGVLGHKRSSESQRVQRESEGNERTGKASGYPNQRKGANGSRADESSDEDEKVPVKTNERAEVETVKYRKRALPTEGFTEEELAAWIEERRKKFPTKRNVALKLEAENQARENGGLPPRPIFPSKDGRSEGRPVSARRPVGSRSRNWEAEGTDKSTGHPQRGGLEPEAKKQPPTALGALAAYGSESEDASGLEECKNVENSARHENPQREKRETGERPANRKKRDRRKGKHQTNGRNPQSPIPNRRRKSLLRNLLEPNVRREQDALLQCIRYIVSADFFLPESGKKLDP
ncbi:hypothetical protein NDN08_004038 [Rhodosorus marinus]|uniref:FMR1-interacting protein 1 conserved domain-containing protein n=1 Tax=Rhodosorus marinus TaxID=101924 RepID=A0AAV8UH54_9RHOD|nr:hypothetical protein NDN08_004038 [Rhodosorus marinus]